jgi:Mg/Co/Ni transporter MgtE
MTAITNYINNDFRALDSQETILAAQDFFIDSSFSHFPVLEEGVYIGSIVANDIETFDTDKKVGDYKYTLGPFFVRPNMIWLDVLEVFGKNQTDIVPVLNENNLYLGYYELADIMRFLNETPFIKEAGGVIIVKKALIDYSMSQITQIVESNNGKLLGIFVSDSDNDTIEITIKVTLGVVNDIIQTFRRYNYEIVSEHNEDNYINTLKERSDYLNKYLNI